MPIEQIESTFDAFVYTPSPDSFDVTLPPSKGRLLDVAASQSVCLSVCLSLPRKPLTEKRKRSKLTLLICVAIRITGGDSFECEIVCNEEILTKIAQKETLRRRL